MIWESDFIMVEEWMVDEGFVSVEIPEIPLEPNAYLLVVELYSNGLESDIILLDDTRTSTLVRINVLGTEDATYLMVMLWQFTWVLMDLTMQILKKKACYLG